MDYTDTTDWADLGNDHRMQYFRWSPNRDLNPQFAAAPDIEKFGAFIAHQTSSGADCMGGIYFDSEAARQVTPPGHHGQFWQVQSWEPLAITPSVLCRTCGDHGWITGGRWVPA